VIHYHHSSSVENYYQEIGRAGRDGKSAWCYLLFSPLDLELHQAGNHLSSSPPKQLARKQQKLRAIYRLASSARCRTQQILEYFGETGAAKCNHCDRCGGVSLKPDSAEKETMQSLTTFLAKSRRLQPIWWQDIFSQRLITLISVYQPHTAQAFESLPGWGETLLKLQPSLLHDFSQCYRPSI
jgi:superfamily II DNA helicase RecQ